MFHLVVSNTLRETTRSPGCGVLMHSDRLTQRHCCYWFSCSHCGINSFERLTSVSLPSVAPPTRCKKVIVQTLFFGWRTEELTVAWSFQEFLAVVLKTSRVHVLRKDFKAESRVFSAGIRQESSSRKHPGGFWPPAQHFLHSVGAAPAWRHLRLRCFYVSVDGEPFASVLLFMESWTHCTALFPFLPLSSFHSLWVFFFYYPLASDGVCVFFFPPISHQLYPKLRLCDAIRFKSRPDMCLLGTEMFTSRDSAALSFPLYRSRLLSYSSRPSFEHLKCMLLYWAEVEIPAGRLVPRAQCVFAWPEIEG